MREHKWGLIALGFALIVTGCAKKSEDQANLQGTGFETATTEELAQLPQANSTSANQQAGIEMLPIETTPMTQGVPPPMPMTAIGRAAENATDAANSANQVISEALSQSSMSRGQLIQTALKNAGLYNGKIDGKIGPASKRAIESFQQSQGLKVDGKVGPRTWAALEPYLSGASSSQVGSSTTSSAE